MELLEGESMSTRLGRGPMPLAEALQVALSVLSALAALLDRASGSEAVECVSVDAGREAAGFRARQAGFASLWRWADADRADRAWSDRRDAAILVAGASDRKAGGRMIGSVRGCRDSFRGVSGQTGVRG